MCVGGVKNTYFSVKHNLLGNEEGDQEVEGSKMYLSHVVLLETRVAWRRQKPIAWKTTFQNNRGGGQKKHNHGGKQLSLEKNISRLELVWKSVPHIFPNQFSRLIDLLKLSRESMDVSSENILYSRVDTVFPKK